MKIEIKGREFNIEVFSVDATELFFKVLEKLDKVQSGKIDSTEIEAFQDLNRELPELVSLILEGNDIDFDAKFFKRKCSMVDLVQFCTNSYSATVQTGTKKNEPATSGK
jgi:hypothetical protein